MSFLLFSVSLEVDNLKHIYCLMEKSANTPDKKLFSLGKKKNRFNNKRYSYIVNFIY